MNGKKGFFSSWKGWAITGGGVAAVAAAAVLVVNLLSGSGRASEHAKVIPADARIVMMVDPGALAEKSNLKEHTAIVDLLREYVDRVPDEIAELSQQLIENPNATGPNASTPVYAFLSGNVTNKMKLGFVFAVDDKEVLKKTISDLSDSFNGDLDFEEEDGLTYCVEDDETFAAFDNSSLLIMMQLDVDRMYRGPEPAKRSHFLALFNQKSEEQFVNTDDFKKMDSTEGEAQLFVSGEIVPKVALDRLERDMKQSGMSLSKSLNGVNLREVRVLLNLSFEQGSAALSYEVYGANEETQAKLEGVSENVKKLTGKYVTLINSDGIFWASINLNGEKIIQSLKAIPDGGNVLLLLEQGLNMDINKVLKSFNGDFALGLNLSSEDMRSLDFEDILKHFAVAADVDNTAFLSEFNNLPSEGDFKVKKTGQNLYTIQTTHTIYDPDYDYDWYYYDDESYAAWEENAYKQVTDKWYCGAVDKSFFFAGENVYGSSMFKQNGGDLKQYKDEIADSYGYAWFNLKPFMQLTNETELRRAPSQLKDLVDLAESVTFRAKTQLSGELRLNVTDKSKNILDVVAGLAAEFIKENLL